MTKLDHLMYAVPDLELGMQQIHELTGIEPIMGGSHPGVGTRNALLSFSADQYLEIIAPDPEQNLAGTTGELLARNPNSGLRAWAVASDDLAAVRDAAATQNVAARDIINMARTTPDGVALAWQLLFLNEPHWPFFIDWQNSPHPALTAPQGCQLSNFVVTTPDPQQYAALLAKLDLQVEVKEGTFGFSAKLTTPNGVVELPSWFR
ncbi:MAG: VOC family protein [Pseudomonadales bacterium]